MGVRIDAAGHDEGAGGVEHGVALEVRADGGDGLALDQHVGLIGAVGGDDGAALDHGRHRRSPSHDLGGLQYGVQQHVGAGLGPFGVMVSSSLWLRPSTQGQKIMAEGTTRFIQQASCPAPEMMSRCE